MVEEITSVIEDFRALCGELPKKTIVDSYMGIVTETIENQHSIINSYESLAKKLEKQILDCQVALDESTKREIEQLQLIMELKNDREKDPAVCKLCEATQEENDILRDQNEQQSLIIDKLSETQELLMLQYKILELNLNKELLHIAKTQDELKEIKGEQAPTDEAQQEAEDQTEEKQQE